QLSPEELQTARTGLGWLLNLQNRDGGIPTFCHGWTNLPFDRSSPDLTAHAMRAWTAWRADFPEMDEQLHDAIALAVRYLAETRQPGRGWVPLWFGNQHAPDEENPTYGTTKVLLALQELDAEDFPEAELLMAGAVMPLVESQHADGSWGGAAGTPASIEETALAVEALAGLLTNPRTAPTIPARHARHAAFEGAQWLVEHVEAGTWTQPAPIGFYFAKLWYYERLYPLIFTVGALERVARIR
ncbi:MAG: squalene--hopene cyclase, partial [Verrucomicrobia bacterium]|nr:squalene--hopene cyclase [Verrucomicrobiota bacterium]